MNTDKVLKEILLWNAKSAKILKTAPAHICHVQSGDTAVNV